MTYKEPNQSTGGRLKLLYPFWWSTEMETPEGQALIVNRKSEYE